MSSRATRAAGTRQGPCASCIGGVIIGTISRSGIRRQRLEPCAGQLARTVLRGGGRSNAISLPDFVYGRRFTTRAPLPGARPVQKPRPRPQWRVVVPDRYPAYVTWQTFEKIQDMLRDNHAEYDRNKTRGIPRPGAALLHGLVYCGECGHKMVVQYKAGTRYICNYLRQQHGVPVCQYLAADP